MSTASSTFLSSYGNTILNQSVHIFSLGSFLIWFQSVKYFCVSTGIHYRSQMLQHYFHLPGFLNMKKVAMVKCQGFLVNSIVLANSFYSLSRKTVNARENFWNVYCLWPIRYEMKPQKITDKLQNGLITTWHKTTSSLFLPQGIFNFTVFKYWNFSFSISALLSPKNRYERHFTEKRS